MLMINVNYFFLSTTIKIPDVICYFFPARNFFYKFENIVLVYPFIICIFFYKRSTVMSTIIDK